MFDITAAEIGVIFFHPFGNIMQRDAVLIEQRWIDNDLELLGLASPRVDFTDPGRVRS